MNFFDEQERQLILHELNTHLSGHWSSHFQANNTVILFQCIDKDSSNVREYSWAISELKLAGGTREVVQIIARKAQERLTAETHAQKTMKNLLRFR